MAERVAVGDVIYPSYDAGTTGLTVGVQVTNKVTGASLLARTTSGVSEVPASGGSYDYQTGYTVPNVAAFKVAWNNTAGAIVATEDYVVVVTAAQVAPRASGHIYATASATFTAGVSRVATGLTGTLGVRITNPTAGTTATARVTAGISEYPSGSGIYVVTLTAPSTAGVYAVVWDTGGGSPTYIDADLTVVSAVLGAGTVSPGGD